MFQKEVHRSMESRPGLTNQLMMMAARESSLAVTLTSGLNQREATAANTIK